MKSYHNYKQNITSNSFSSSFSSFFPFASTTRTNKKGISVFRPSCLSDGSLTFYAIEFINKPKIYQNNSTS